MTELEEKIIKQLKQLVPGAEQFEVRANIGDKSSSVEFFATIDGIKHQCYDMIDNGEMKEQDFDAMVKQLAKFIRTCSEYRPGEINKFSFAAEA